MVVQDFHVVVGGELFEGALGLDVSSDEECASDGRTGVGSSDRRRL